MEGNKLFVKSLSYQVTENQLKNFFSLYGEVKSIKHFQERGFAFIEFETPEIAEKIKDALNNTEFEGRFLNIEIAWPFVPKNQRKKYY